jgi:DnaJ homologue, subfamily C, member 28, conserved domain
MHFTDLAIQIIADDKIRTAIKRGEFDRLPGLGKPLLFEEADDVDWWLRRKLCDEGLQDKLPLLSR